MVVDSRSTVAQGLISWEIPRLCRGGSRSLTFRRYARPELALVKKASPWERAHRFCGRGVPHQWRSDSDGAIKCLAASLYSWNVGGGWELGPFERPPTFPRLCRGILTRPAAPHRGVLGPTRLIANRLVIGARSPFR
jgi:hypothetical protein